MAKAIGSMVMHMSVDDSKVTPTINTMKQQLRDLNGTWKANVQAAKAAGDNLEAVKAKAEGLTAAAAKQKEILDSMNTIMRNTGERTEKNALAYDKMASGIQRAEAQYKSLTNQQQLALSVLDRQETGIDELNKSIKANDDLVQSQIKSLKSEGNELEANRLKTERLEQKKKDLQVVQEKEEQILKNIADRNGQGTRAYTEQATAVQAAKNRIADNNDELKRYSNRIEDNNVKLKELKSSYSSLKEFQDSYITRLRAEGSENEANVADVNKLKSAYRNLAEQYKLQVSAMNSSTVGSDGYHKAYVEANKTATEMERVSRQSHKTQETINSMNPYGISKIGSAFNGVSRASEKMSDKVLAGYQAIRRNAATVALTVGIAGGAIVKGAQLSSDLENSYIKTNNLLVTGGEKAKEVSSNVNQMQKDGAKYSREYGYSQQSIADGYVELVKRGYTSNQALGAQKTLLETARASGDDYSDVIRNTATALENFGLRTDNTNQMMKNTSVTANQMAYAADMTATDFQSMGKAMEYVGTSAHQSGFSLSETASAIGILSNNGLEADKAGTGLRKAISSLQAPSKTAQGALSELGLSTKDFIDQHGKMKSMTDIFTLLKEKTQGMSQAQQGTIFHNLFGATGQMAGGILTENANALGTLNQKVKDSADGQGYVHNLSKKNMQSTKAQLDQLKVTLQDVSMTIGNAMLPSLSRASKDIQKTFDSPEGKKALKQFADGLAKATSVLLTMIEFMGKHTTTVKAFGAALGSIFVIKKTGDLIASFKTTLDYIAKLSAAKAAYNKVPFINRFAEKPTPKVPTTRMEKFGRVATKGVESGALKTAGATAAGAAGTEVAMAGAGSVASSGALASVAAVAAPIAAVAAAVAGVGLAFYEAYKHVKFFRDGVNETADSINKNFIKPITKGFSYISDSVVQAWNGFSKSFGKGFKSVFKDLPTVFKPFDEIKKTLKGVVEDVTKLFSPMGKKGGIIDSITTQLNKIGDWFGAHQKQIDAFGKFIGKTVGYITVALEGMAVFVVKVFASMIVPAIKAFIDIFKVGYNFIALQVKGIIGIFKILGDLFTGHFKEAGKEFVNTFKGMFSSSVKLFKSFFGLIGNIVMIGVKAIDSIIEQIFGTKKNPIERFFTSAWKSTKKTFSALGSDIAKIGKSIAKTIGLIWSGISKGTVKTFKSLVKDVSNIFSGVGKIISKTWKSISKGTVNTFNVIVKNIKSIGKNIEKAFSSIWNRLIKTFSWFIKTETKGIKNLFNFFVKIWNNLNKTINKIASKLWNGVAKSLSSFVRWFKKTWNNLSGFFNDLWNDLRKSISKTANKLWNSIGDGVRGFIKWFKKTWNSLSDFFNDLWNDMKKSIVKISSRLWDTITDRLNDFFGSFKRTWNNLKNFFGNTWNGIKGIGSRAINSLKDTLGGGLGKIGKSFGDTWNGVKTGFGKFWDGMKRMASDGLNAVISPINSGINGINSLISDFGGSKHAIGNIPKVKFANGTGAIDRLTHAVLNDGNDSPETGNKETLIHPNGKMEVVQGRNTQRLLLPGTEVLNASETKMLMAMQGVRHFADGTGFFGGLWKGVKSAGSTVANVAGDVWDGTKSVASSAWNGIKDTTKKFTEMFKFITNAVAHPIKTLEGVFNPKNGGLTGAIGDITGGFIKKSKNQAKDWWSELWSMAKDAGESSNGSAKGNDYPWNSKGKDSGTDPWGYFYRECVSFVASRLKNMGVSPSLFSHLGNGSDWVNAKVKHTKSPKAGDVAVYSAGSQFGNHVAMVNGVSGGKISGEDMNWDNDGKYHTYSGRPISGVTTFLDFGGSSSGSDDDKKETKANGPLQKLIQSQVGGMFKWIKKWIAPLNDDEGSGGKAGDVQSWSNDVKKALEKNGLSTSSSMVKKVLRQINTESSGNEKAIQGIHDVNSGGNEARGLMQTIPSTFNAYKFPGHGNIMNGYDNLLAALAYAKSRYGSSLSALGNGHGYANGGLITKHQVAEIGEGNKPEMIIPLDGLKSSRGYELLGKTMSVMAARDNLASQSTNTDGLEKLEAKFDSMIQLLGQLVQGQANPTPAYVIANQASQEIDRLKGINNRANRTALG